MSASSVETLRLIKQIEEKARKTIDNAEQQADEIKRKSELEADRVKAEITTAAKQMCTRMLSEAATEIDGKAQAVAKEASRTITEIREKASRQNEKAIRLVIRKLLGVEL